MVSLSQPPGDYRLFVDGSYKDGFIGFGALILPGYHEYYHGEAGPNASIAELKAVELALRHTPINAHCIVYTDLLSLVTLINTPEFAETHQRQVEARYMSDQSPHHRRAHELANQGRIWAEKGSVKKRKP